MSRKRRAPVRKIYSDPKYGSKVISKFIFKNAKLPGLIHLDSIEVTAAGIQLSEFVEQMESYGLKAGKTGPRELLEAV